jgi:hypothetical protein
MGTGSIGTIQRMLALFFLRLHSGMLGIPGTIHYMLAGSFCTILGIFSGSSRRVCFVMPYFLGMRDRQVAEQAKNKNYI